jgi:hypothetical protein
MRVKREYQRVYNVHRNATTNKQNIKNCHTKFKENGNVGRKKGAGRPRTNPADFSRFQNRFQQSPTVSLRRESIKLNLPPSTVHGVLKKTMHFFPYKIQVLHELKQSDYHLRFQHASSQFDIVYIDPNALIRDAYSDECIFFSFWKS